MLYNTLHKKDGLKKKRKEKQIIQERERNALLKQLFSFTLFFNHLFRHFLTIIDAEK